jgi:hypothetical protein
MSSPLERQSEEMSSVSCRGPTRRKGREVGKGGKERAVGQRSCPVGRALDANRWPSD